MSKIKSRPTRWAEAVGEAREAIDRLNAAVETLREIQGEYEDWQANLPDNLLQSTLADKLEEVINLDLDLDVDESVIDGAEAADLPLGFGRD